MSKISLGYFDRIEIFETRTVRKAPGIQLVHAIAIAALVVLAIVATVEAHLQIAELYQMEPTAFLSP